MIPLKLTVEGLYSYQERQTIDFTQLTSSGIFGVFGKVGSGKSAILDAITFALYEKTDRTDTDWDYNMMNLKSNELFIEFEFLNKDNQKYQFTVYRKRSSRTFSNISQKEHTAKQWMNGIWEKADHKQVEKIVGLSYENFKRTIIIPQGKFQEFLQLKSRERTDMLKEIFSLHRYDLQNKVKALMSENNDRIKEIEGIMRGIGEVTKEGIEEEEELLAGIREKLAETSAQLTRKMEAREEEGQLKELFGKLESVREKVRAMAAEKEAIDIRIKQLALYERALRDFKDLLKRIDQEEKGLEKLKNEILTKENLFAAKQQQASTWEQELETWRTDYEKLDQWREEADDLQLIAQIRKDEKELDTKRLLVRNRQTKYTERDEEKNKLIQLIRKRKQELQDLKTQLPDPEILRAQGVWLKKAELLVDQRTERTDEFQRTDQEMAKKLRGLETLIKNAGSLLPEDAVQLNPEALIEHLNEKEDIGKQFRDENDDQLNQLRVKLGLLSYADDLSDGDPCPLCGSLHHPDLEHGKAQDRSGLEKEISKKEGQRKAAKDRLDNILALRGKIHTQWELIQAEEKNLKAKKAQVAEAQKAIDAHQKSFPGKGDPNPAAYREAEALDKTLRQRIQDWEGGIAKAESELEILRDDLVRFQADVEQANKDISVMEKGMELNRGRLRRLREVDFPGKDSVILMQMAMRKQEERDEVKNRFEDREKKLEALNKTMLPLKGELTALKGNLETAEQELAQEKATLKARLENAPFASAQEIQTLIQLSLDIEKEKREIEAFRTQQAETSALLKELEGQAEGKTFDQQKLDQLINEVSGASGSERQGNPTDR